ncbi:MAG TPA: hypothetical protein VNM48_00135, partial [Chloroflexota bacterium]|nr:hypothetical protein [Chloroflexota bacterium]
VFPQFRLNANVNEHPRGALLAFMEGALLNVIPGNMHSFRLRDCPELVATLRKLASLRRRFLRYFTEGQYRYVEGLTVTGCTARLYTHGKDVLVIACNPTDQPVDASVEIDPAAWGAPPAPGTLRVLDLDGVTVIEQPCAAGVLRQHLNMQADTLHAFEITQRNT